MKRHPTTIDVRSDTRAQAARVAAWLRAERPRWRVSDPVHAAGAWWVRATGLGPRDKMPRLPRGWLVKVRNPVLSQSGGMSAGVAAKQRKALLADLARQQKRDYHSRVAGLRQEAKHAKADRRRELATARAGCKDLVVTVRAQADAEWTAEREAALSRRRAKKRGARETCATEKATIRQTAAQRIAAAKAGEKDERVRRDELRRLEAHAKKRGKLRSTSAERRTESDDAVLANIPPELEPLWHKVKRSIRSTDRMSRTEAFLKYADENPGEAIAAQEESHSDEGFAAEWAAYGATA